MEQVQAVPSRNGGVGHGGELPVVATAVFELLVAPGSKAGLKNQPGSPLVLGTLGWSSPVWV